ncbi:hypothetical protein F3J23_09250 [Chryseobacterium sp. Tr-659]|uniref:energy transducer TonB n=1 Tax=Chryseobacterium sp. Tr-659 TaxID=2608340 RepID=UPI001421CEFE|nr:hypothetical protein [Chryseobacterium sp. Tr-659]NIF05629.1 hypothetical protein [Chryseobacterium sp. Tr-659]
MKKYCSLFLLLAINFYFSQQTEGLKRIKEKYDTQIQEIKNKYAEDSLKVSSRKLAKVTLKKNDDIYNLNAQRNNEYLEEAAKIKAAYKPSEKQSGSKSKSDNETSAKHLDGAESFKKEISDNMYTYGISLKGKVESRVSFAIEKDGSITFVNAKGNNEKFNKQAELAVLLTQKKWEPATRDHEPVVSYMGFPISLNFD